MQRLSITFSGPAGAWINTVGKILGDMLSEAGFFVIGDKEYSSIIKGENNIVTLYISREGYFVSRDIDCFFALDAYGIEKNRKIYNLSQTIELFGKDNMYMLGLGAKYLGFQFEEIDAFMASRYPYLYTLIEKIRLGYAEGKKSSFDVGHGRGTPRVFSFGNEVLANGAIASGLNFFSGYPMTPASSLIDVIMENPGVTFFQGEDEIAVAMAMLGAKYAGSRAACGTSGGGFALMTESIAFSNQAEIGGVYILSQRTGPSTGTPTFTEQSDMHFACHASFGDTLPIVAAPSTFEEGYQMAGKALNWSDMYQHPVILLSDKQFSESYVAIGPSHLQSESINRGKIELDPTEAFARYSDVSDGIPTYTIPWTKNGEFIATSYDHDEFGSTSEDPEIKAASMKRRFQKLESFVRNEFGNSFSGYQVFRPEARNFFVCIGFVRYTIEGFLQNHPDWGYIVITVLQPFDPGLKDFLEARYDQVDRIVFVDNNYTWQLEKIVTDSALSEKWIPKIDRFRKFTLYPIFEEELWELI